VLSSLLRFCRDRSRPDLEEDAGRAGAYAAPAPLVIRIVRVYDLALDDEGARYLVDRVWPRGITKSSLRLTGWLREAAPSHELRRWFGHDPTRWPEFRRRYAAELDAQPSAWRPLIDAAAGSDVLLLYAARDSAHNNAVALRDYLEQHRLDRHQT